MIFLAVPVLRDCKSMAKLCGAEAFDAAKALSSGVADAGPMPAALLASTKKS